MHANLAPIGLYAAAIALLGGGLGYASFLLVTRTPVPLRRVMLLSALWHLLLMTFVGVFGYKFLHLDDPVYYDQVTIVLLNRWRHGIFPGFDPLYLTSVGYYGWMAAFYELFGRNPLLPQLANILLALLAGAVTHRITRRLGGSPAAAWWVATAVLFYPTLAVWSVMLLKDMLADLLLLICLDLALTLEDRPSVWTWVQLAAVAFVLSTLRFYFGVVSLLLGIAIGMTALLLPRVRRRLYGDVPVARTAVLSLAGSGLLFLTFVGILQFGEGPWYVQYIRDPQRRMFVAAAMSNGESSLDHAPTAPTAQVHLGTESPQGTHGAEAAAPAPEPAATAGVQRPVGTHVVETTITRRAAARVVSSSAQQVWKIVRFFLVPLPSATGTMMQIGKLDWLVWWPLPILAALGTRRGWRLSWWRTLTIALPAASMVVFLALIVGNAGSLVRYRAMLFPLSAVLGGLGLDALADSVPAGARVLWNRFA